MKRIDCFIPAADQDQIAVTISRLKSLSIINRIYLLSTDPEVDLSHTGMEVIAVDNLSSSSTVAKIAERSSARYTLIYTKYTTLEPGYFAWNAWYVSETIRRPVCCMRIIFRS